jgi:hypothetical protein
VVDARTSTGSRFLHSLPRHPQRGRHHLAATWRPRSKCVSRTHTYEPGAQSYGSSSMIRSDLSDSSVARLLVFRVARTGFLLTTNSRRCPSSRATNPLTVACRSAQSLIIHNLFLELTRIPGNVHGRPNCRALWSANQRQASVDYQGLSSPLHHGPFPTSRQPRGWP